VALAIRSNLFHLLHSSLRQVAVDISAETEGGCMNAAKHASVQDVDKTLKAQNSVPSSICAVPAIAGPTSKVSIRSFPGGKVVKTNTYRLA
jgi:hypothetical protein